MTNIKFLKAVGHPDGTVENIYDVFGSQKYLLKRTLSMPEFADRKIIADFRENGERKCKRFFSFSEFCKFSEKVDLEACTVIGMVFLGLNKNRNPIYSPASVCADFKAGTLTISSKEISAIWDIRARIVDSLVFPIANIDVELKETY